MIENNNLDEREKKTKEILSLLEKTGMTMEELEDIASNHEYYIKETKNLKAECIRLKQVVSEKMQEAASLQEDINRLQADKNILSGEIQKLNYNEAYLAEEDKKLMEQVDELVDFAIKREKDLEDYYNAKMQAAFESVSEEIGKYIADTFGKLEKDIKTIEENQIIYFKDEQKELEKNIEEKKIEKERLRQALQNLKQEKTLKEETLADIRETVVDYWGKIKNAV